MTDALPLLKSTRASCTCPVCLDVFKDPVGLHCGHVLCRSCVVRCISVRPRCPLCNQSVPNVRHILPLPQLALFCVLTREVGLRVLPLAPVKEAEKGVVATADCCSGGKRGHAEDGAVQWRPPQQRARTESLSLPRQWGTTDHLPEVMLHNTAGDTQRLYSATPERSPPPSATAPAYLAPSSDSPCAPSPPQEGVMAGPEKESGGIVSTPAPLAAAPFTFTTTRASPLSPTLALLQARFAEDAEQLESTPRLTASIQDTGIDSSHGDEACLPQREAPLQPTGTPSGVPSWWRSWRYGQGVVHCSLIPPAVRLRVAAHEKQRKKTNRSGADWGENVPNVALTPGWSPRGSNRTTASSSVSESLEAVEVTRLHRCGCCVLCGLDVVQRNAVRRRLQDLLHSPFAQCDPAELAAQTEDGLSLLLGPLWGVSCVVDTQGLLPAPALCTTGTYISTGGARDPAECGHGDVDVADSGLPPQRRAVPVPLRAVAHHNCLAWAGLLDLYTDTSLEVEGAANASVPTTTTVLQLTVPLQDPFELCASHTSGRVARWQLLAAALWHQRHYQQAKLEVEAGLGHAAATPHCALCEAPPTPLRLSAGRAIFGVGLRTCEGTERGESSCGRQFHYPCALLAGASACLVFGLEDSGNVLRAADGACACHAQGVVERGGHPVEVWCGPCRERHESRRRS
ncbi:hypothetical protein ABL78_5649 [Leptomonas seymouri]|uniref:RING-type domain-containing protein n=1 Tax=Leptomonas seymouri TaxID=5684 RepID=A0A0N1IJ27_LEPSE|nr:hypothetical protein ABL78_5649 [Leptomonas seymouri]|eukprot:KPI85282.1 hypothetical protein ABL78_5649 [Leptomonas seymouri]